MVLGAQVLDPGQAAAACSGHDRWHCRTRGVRCC